MYFGELNRSITFYVKNEVNRQAVAHLAEVAEHEGYDVTMTDDRTRRAEIGIYPSPIRVPYVNAELSIAMFHGMDSSFVDGYWPRFDWSRFDIGLLPGTAAAENWRRCSTWPHANPKIGVFKVGWPKADPVVDDSFDTEVSAYKHRYGIGDGNTILYAPVAESRGKIHEFVEHAGEVGDVLLIKHGPMDGGYALPDDTSLADLYEQYRDREDIYILNENDSIYYGLALADILVSEQTSVITDAAVTDTVPVSVLNWPQRGDPLPEPKTELPNFAVRTRTWELESTVNDVYANYDRYLSRVHELRPHYYYALGNSAKLIINLIDKLLEGDLLPVEPVTPRDSPQHKYAFQKSLIRLEALFSSLRWSTVGALSEEQKRVLRRYGGQRALDYYDDVFKFFR
jgi:hypothetical protein